MNYKQAAKWILRNTVVSSDSLTPQFRLRLITESCPLWMSTPDKCPLPDPYWAFYWPGGQAISKYISEHKEVFDNSLVVDVGCGCGSASIASIECGALAVIANDIDRNALVATKLNFRLNRIADHKVVYTDRNLLLPESDDFLLKKIDKGKPIHLILGDMFYDSDFALAIFEWLKRLTKQTDNVRIFIGDPDRHPLAEEEYSKRYRRLFIKRQIEEYALPGYVIREHYGFNVAKVYEIFMI